jgi:RNA polymerase sigma factor (sigma-70 family)
MDEELDRWFIREVLVHEASLTRYLARMWSAPDDILDIRQDSYVRVYEAAAKARPLRPKSFLFQTARHLMVDRLRRKRVVSIESVEDLDALNVSIDELSPERRVSALQELRHLAQAFDQLPVKCRRVVWMRKVEGLSQREVAQRLNIVEETVEKHVARGMQFLAKSLFGNDISAKLRASRENAGSELGDEQQQTD